MGKLLNLHDCYHSRESYLISFHRKLYVICKFHFVVGTYILGTPEETKVFFLNLYWKYYRYSPPSIAPSSPHLPKVVFYYRLQLALMAPKDVISYLEWDVQYFPSCMQHLKKPCLEEKFIFHTGAGDPFEMELCSCCYGNIEFHTSAFCNVYFSESGCL